MKTPAACHVVGMASAVLLLGIPMVAGAVPETTVSFSVADVAFSTKQGFDVVEMQGCHLAGEPGEPLLPCMAVNFVIPRDKQVASVKFELGPKQKLPGSYYVYPAQPPTPVGGGTGEGEFAWPDPSIYGSADPFPGIVIAEGRETVDWGWVTYQLTIWPLEYLPAYRELWLHASVDVSLELVDREEALPQVLPRSEEQHKEWAEQLEEIVANPADVWAYEPGGATLTGAPPKWVLILPGLPQPGEDRGWHDSFEPLIQWRQQQGYVTVVGYAEQISPSHDYQDIREYLQDQWEEGARWACLAGDHEMIPWTYTTPGYPTYADPADTIPNDWCYCDLDGEYPQDHDWAPELWVGRVPCTSHEEAGNFVDKALQYEQYDGDPAYLERAFYESADQCTDWQSCEEVISHHDSTLWYAFWPEEPSGGAQNPTAPYAEDIVTELSSTLYNYVTVHCHGGPEMYGAMTKGYNGETVSPFGPARVADLTNTGHYYFWYSISCNNAWLDWQLPPPDLRTMAESATCVYPERCAVAFAGNTRSGYISDNLVLSTRLQCCAWHYLFPPGPYRPYFNHAGHVEAMSKWWYYRLGYDWHIPRYIRFSHNLFGDPATGIWTPRATPSGKLLVAEDAPAPLAIALVGCHPNPVGSEGTLRFTVDRAARVRVSVYDITGQLVQVVHDGTVAAGTSAQRWDCARLPSGVYMVRAEAGGVEISERAVVLK